VKVAPDLDKHHVDHQQVSAIFPAAVGAVLGRSLAGAEIIAAECDPSDPRCNIRLGQRKATVQQRVLVIASADKITSAKTYILVFTWIGQKQ
jgi:hypothetical protein